MKPVSITMKAFGSYLGQTTIDFTKLGENPIFLITGATGGGKTTILDAMCFALYCRATGGRRSWSSMVNTAAPRDAETLVDFVFLLGGETYRFFRSQQRYAARGSGAIKVKEEHCCYRMEDGEWSLIISGAESRVREKAEQILGLTCEQFSQVMVLPQGDFLKLLLASSREKAQMFQTLFATDRWANVTLRLKGMAEEVQQQMKAAAAAKALILEREESSTAEELEQKRAETEKALAAAETELSVLEKELELQTAAYNSALILSRKFSDFQALQNAMQALDGKKEEIGQKKAALAKSRAARTIYPYFTAFQNARRDHSAKRSANRAAQDALSRAAAEREAARELPNAVREYREKATASAQQAVRLEAALDAAKRYQKIQDGLKQNEARFAAAQKEQDQYAAALQDAQTRFQAGRTYLETARAESREFPRLAAEADRLVRQNAAAALAAGLEDGTPCPVCGAVHHPSPAAQSAELEAVREKLKQATKAGDRLEKYEKRLRELEEIQKNAQERLNAVQKASTELERGRASLNAAASELAAALNGQSDPKKAEADLLAAKAKAVEYSAAADRAEHRITETQSAAAGAQAAAKAARQAEEESDAARQETESRWIEQARAAHWDPETDFSKILLSPNEEAAAERELENYGAALHSSREQLEKLKQELNGAQQPDTESAKQRLDDIRQKASQIAQRKGMLTRTAEAVRGSLKKLAELDRQNAGLEERYARTSRLSLLLAGKTGMKIPLHQFVLGIMLDDIISCANQFFSIFSNGRYRLNRVSGASGGNALGGLDLQVFDAYSGGIRGVETLSGGELFLASLSLAFGLSDVVQGYSGSVHLDSIFIDEGFGSLDQDTLDTAMKALLTIRQKGRTIGIISHVSELKTRIPAQIVVSKAADGGSVAEIIA